MYGLAPQIDLTFLRGLKLVQICISSVQVQFHFLQPGHTSSDTGISVETSYTHRHGSDEYQWSHDVRASNASSVLFLIDNEITDFRGDSDGTLMLVFSNGDSLTFLDETPDYQAYQIWHGDDPLIVV